jgi:hypothetical protein
MSNVGGVDKLFVQIRIRFAIGDAPAENFL